MDTKNNSLDKILSLCKRRGFVYAGSDIYHGISGFWDYGPMGTQMKRAIEDLWWKYTVEWRDNVIGLDTSIIGHQDIWKASGHLDRFDDKMVDCKSCKSRMREDQMEDKTKCSKCNSEDLTEPQNFNLMMSTKIGPIADDGSTAYLRAETCQAIFTNFKNVLDSSRIKLPFGIAQIGKAFRNEITPRNFLFRCREFTQMELEFFCEEANAEDFYNYWKQQRLEFYQKYLKFTDQNLRIVDHSPDQLAHYAKMALDFEFKYPFGWGELEGVHHRGQWDLTCHQTKSGTELSYSDPEKKGKIVPTVIETSVGLDRLFLALICNAYDEDTAPTQKENKDTDTRYVLRLPALIAPIQVAVLPLIKKLDAETRPIFENLRRHFRCDYDIAATIGKRYRRYDEIGTPYCITFDFDSREDSCVTVRDRDDMGQKRVAISELKNYLDSKLSIS